MTCNGAKFNFIFSELPPFCLFPAAAKLMEILETRTLFIGVSNTRFFTLILLISVSIRGNANNARGIDEFLKPWRVKLRYFVVFYYIYIFLL